MDVSILVCNHYVAVLDPCATNSKISLAGSIPSRCRILVRTRTRQLSNLNIRPVSFKHPIRGGCCSCVALGNVVARGEAVDQGGGKLWQGRKVLWSCRELRRNLDKLHSFIVSACNPI